MGVQHKGGGDPTTQNSPFQTHLGIDATLGLQRQVSRFENCLPPDPVTQNPPSSQGIRCEELGDHGHHELQILSRKLHNAQVPKMLV